MNKPKAIVIGAGLGGLAVSLRLAALNWNVEIYEQGATAGGKMNRWAKDGYTFDTGPSLMTIPWIFSELFASAGEDINDYIKIEAVDPLASYFFDDGVHFQMSAALPEWLKAIRKLYLRDEQGFLKFMRLGSRIFSLSAQTFFQRAPFEPPDKKTLLALFNMPLRHAWGRYDQTIKYFFKSPYLQKMYERFPTYIGSSPFLTPATLMVIPFLEHAFGGWYIKGGMYELVESLIDLIKKMGVRLNNSQAVERIVSRNRRVQGIELSNGAFHECDVVIMNGDASMTGIMLGKSGASPLQESERSLSGFILLLGIKRRLPDQAQHTVYFSNDYQAEFNDLFNTRCFPEDPTVYVNMPSKNDRTVVPPGGETLFIMANAPANDNEIWDDQEIDAASRRVMQRLKKSGFPDIDNDIVVSSVWTP
ncbi:MAG: phytoene desaturase family protein, partial [Thermodesulfobacteriota bacterium]|nr:phytoene desaturase family protein [Thermodesulfobacteriota bacterium]